MIVLAIIRAWLYHECPPAAPWLLLAVAVAGWIKAAGEVSAILLLSWTHGNNFWRWLTRIVTWVSCELLFSLLTFYRLWDNIDKTVRHRYMRTDSQGSGSFHYFHSYAAADRAQLRSESPSAVALSNCAQALLILPSLEDEYEITSKSSFHGFCATSCQETFDGKHQYYDEMSKKSDTVSDCLLHIHTYLH